MARGRVGHRARAGEGQKSRRDRRGPRQGHRAAGGAGKHGTWAYEGTAGPQAWGALKPEFSLCANGQRQSPIDIQGGLAVDLEPVQFDCQSSRFAIIDNGHTVQVNLAPGNAIELGGRRFELQQFHFHRPAEERIDGRALEMSLHLVNKDGQGRLAVVALLFDRGPPQPVVQQVWKNLPLEKHQETAARATLDLSELLPADRRYCTYLGSLTTPPCSEGVQWVVMRQPLTLAPEQIDLFARLYPTNARPVQAVAGRRIMQSNQKPGTSAASAATADRHWRTQAPRRRSRAPAGRRHQPVSRSAHQHIRTAAPANRPARRSSSAWFALVSGYGCTLTCRGISAATRMKSTPSWRVRLATETMRLSPHSQR